MSSFTKHLTNRAPERILTPLNKTCAITIHSPKTAALIFDKVFAPMERDQEFPYEVAPYASKNGRLSMPHFSGQTIAQQRWPNGRTEVIGAPDHASFSRALAGANQQMLTRLCQDGFRPVLCEPNPTSDRECTGPERYEMAVACISNLDIVSEEELTWEQVLEFRKDRESRIAVMSFLAYLGAMKGKTLAEIQHKLATLYNKRRHALQKFGIYTKSIVSSAFAVSRESLAGLLAAAASAAGLQKIDSDPRLALAVAGVPIVNNMIASVRMVRSELALERDALRFHSALIRMSEAPATKASERMPEAPEANAPEEWSWQGKTWTF